MDNVSHVPEGPRHIRLGKGAQVWVAGSGVPILLLHGFGLRPNVFMHTLERLAARGFEVAAPTLAVVGREWDLDRAVYRATKTLDALEWDRAIVVGYSLGGAVATALAARHPERVRMLALVNSVGFKIDRNTLAWARPFMRYTRMRNLVALRAFIRNASEFGGLQNLASAARFARFGDMEDEIALAKFNGVRSIVLWGTDDRLLPTDGGRQLAAALDAPLHLIPNADHDWVVIQPALFARELDHMLRGALLEETPEKRKLRRSR